MALLKEIANTGNRRTDNCGYWIVESHRYEKSTGKTAIDVGGYETKAVRQRMFPQAESRRTYLADGDLDVPGCYDHIKANESDFDGSVDG